MNNNERKINRLIARILHYFIKYHSFSTRLESCSSLFYIRFYGYQVYISPKIFAKKLQKDAKEKFKNFKSTFGKQRCFVIGNGPSLNELDMTKLKNEVTIGSNGIFLNFPKMGFYPTFLTVTNYLIAEQMGRIISSIEDSIHIFPIFLKDYFKNCSGKALFLNADKGLCASDDVTKWISWQSTVTFFNLQIAFSLGCPEVYLIGVDNNYKTHVGQCDGQIIVQEKPDPNHFTTNYFTQGFRWQQADTYNMEKCYILIKQLYKENGRKIYNAGVGGKLEVFKRIEYNSLFS